MLGVAVNDYCFKTEPYPHQRDVFLRTRDLPAWAHFWDPRTGKSKITIDEAAYSFERGRINGVLVLAPNGVHANWVRNEIPAHCPDRVRPHAFAYHTSQAKTRAGEAALAAAINAPGLSFLAMTYEALTTERGASAAKRFLSARDVLEVPDEAHRIKTYTAKRTRYVLKSGRLAKMRRVLTGTPVTQSPFDVYCPILFLDEEFWKHHGFAGLTAFKTHFGVWETGYGRGREFKRVVAYRHIDQLRDILGNISDRVSGEAVLGMPPLVYTKRYFSMTPEQARVYRDLRDRFVTELESGDTITADLAITRLLRLQQVTSGYLPTEDGRMIPIPGGNPRLASLLDALEDEPEPTIIWARFTPDVEQIVDALRAGGASVIRYDGAVKDTDRAACYERFQAGEAQYFVGNVGMGEGIPLYRASKTVYYSNSFRLTDRIQTEDRMKVTGKLAVMGVTDLICASPDGASFETVDERIVDALRQKFDIASQVTGDTLRTWL